MSAAGNDLKTFSTKLGPLPANGPSKELLETPILGLFSLKGKTASISGSSAGIGLAVTEGFAQAGADVAMWYNSSEIAVAKAAEFSKKYNVKVKAYKCKITDEEQVNQTIDQQLRDFGGKIDIFVANAGIAYSDGEMVANTDSEKQWKKFFDVNVHGVYYCSKRIGQIFKKQGHGSLVMTASMSASIVNVPQLQTVYNASKAAVKHMAKSLAVEWTGFARVNSISPGYISTDISKFADQDMKNYWWQATPLGREGNVKELVGAYLYLASDALTYTTGCDLVVDGGYSVI